MACGKGGGAYSKSEREANFWRKVDIRKKNECWLWQGSTYTNGYGSFWNGSKLIGAHVFSASLRHGPIKKGLYVCHTCDIKNCVNPNHLFIGTPVTNQLDMLSKDRGNKARGVRQALSKMTEDEVRAIRNSPHSSRKTAKLYGVTGSTVLLIRSRKTWKHVL